MKNTECSYLGGSLLKQNFSLAFSPWTSLFTLYSPSSQLHSFILRLLPWFTLKSSSGKKNPSPSKLFATSKKNCLLPLFFFFLLPQAIVCSTVPSSASLHPSSLGPTTTMEMVTHSTTCPMQLIHLQDRPSSFPTQKKASPPYF